MAFDRQQAKVPAAIGTLTVTLKDWAITDETPTAGKSAHFTADVLGTDGVRLRQLQGNLLPHITTAQRNALVQFMDSLRAQAIKEILP